MVDGQTDKGLEDSVEQRRLSEEELLLEHRSNLMSLVSYSLEIVIGRMRGADLAESQIGQIIETEARRYLKDAAKVDYLLLPKLTTAVALTLFRNDRPEEACSIVTDKAVLTEDDNGIALSCIARSACHEGTLYEHLEDTYLEAIEQCPESGKIDFFYATALMHVILANGDGLEGIKRKNYWAAEYFKDAAQNFKDKPVDFLNNDDLLMWMYSLSKVVEYNSDEEVVGDLGRVSGLCLEKGLIGSLDINEDQLMENVNFAWMRRVIDTHYIDLKRPGKKYN